MDEGARWCKKYANDEKSAHQLDHFQMYAYELKHIERQNLRTSDSLRSLKHFGDRRDNSFDLYLSRTPSAELATIFFWYIKSRVFSTANCFSNLNLCNRSAFENAHVRAYSSVFFVKQFESSMWESTLHTNSCELADFTRCTFAKREHHKCLTVSTKSNNALGNMDVQANEFLMSSTRTSIPFLFLPSIEVEKAMSRQTKSAMQQVV